MENQKFTFNCPHCGQPLEAETDWVGLECDCIYCGKTLQVPKPTPIITVMSSPNSTYPCEKPPAIANKISFWKRIPKWAYGLTCVAAFVLIGFAATQLMGRENTDNAKAHTEATESTEKFKISTETHSTSPRSQAGSSAESLCEEFLNGGNSYKRKDDYGKFWTSFGVPFQRIGKTTVRWQKGSETPPSICMVEFKNDGTALVTEDNTFFAREFRRNSLSEIANALKRAFELMNNNLDYVVSVTTSVTDDGRILFSALVRVSSGSVSNTIGNTLFGMAKCRTFLRM